MISGMRRIAQAVRHAPLLRSMTPLWRLLRGPYLRAMRFAGSSAGIPVTVGGTRMRLHPDFATQNWETVEYASYRAFAEMLRPGDAVLDIGAHIGTYSIIAQKLVGDAGRVIAYEPYAVTRRYLQQHLEWNGASAGVSVRPVCCAEKEGTSTFYYLPDRAEGMNGLVAVDGFESCVVPVTTVDREVATLGISPALIKIDVEGAEWKVLQGAEDTLRRGGPALCLSLHPAALAKQGATPEQVIAWLEDRSYDVRVIARDHEVHVVARRRDLPH